MRVFRAVTGRYPHKINYDRVISKIGTRSAEEITPYYEEWVARGFNPIGLGWLDWHAPGHDTPALRLKVRDKRRLDAGQAVTWVVQGDGLQPLPDDAPQPAVDDVVLAVQCTAMRLGEMSLATLALDDLPGVALQLTRPSPL